MKQSRDYRKLTVGITREAILQAGLAAMALICASPTRAQSKPAQTASTGARSAAATLRQIPVGAQSVVSATLGNADPSYRAKVSAQGYATENPANHLAAQYAANGVEIRSHNAKLDFEFDSWGYGKPRVNENKAAITPVVNSNRLEYRRGDLTEWYVNGPLGIEQGFTISRPPTTLPDSDHDALDIALRLRGNLSASVEPGRHALTLRDRKGAQALRYGPLLAYDASGRELESWMELQHGSLQLRVNTAGAQYPITVDPWVQAAKLTNSLGLPGDGLGESVAINATGDTVVVGAPFAKIGSNASQGAAYVFVEPANGWATTTTYTAELINNSGAAGDRFGASVGISGNTIVVGAPFTAIGSNAHQGAAYVFVEPTSGGWVTPTTVPTWNAQLTTSTGSGAAGENLGSSVGISGNTVVAGADQATIGSSAAQGAAYVFVESTWSGSLTSDVELTASDGAAGDAFGGAVGIDQTANTVVVGALYATIGSSAHQGAAYVFAEPTSGGWATTSDFSTKLTASGGAAGDNLGWSVGINEGGDTVVAGAPNVKIGSYAGQGAAYVFVEPANGWATAPAESQTAELTASSGAPSTAFGYSVGINGNTIMVGATGVSIGSTLAVGAAYVFVEPTNGWASAPAENQTAELTASGGGAQSFLGLAVGIGGGTVVAGAPGISFGSNSVPGAAYVFTDGAPAISPATLEFGDVALNATSTAQSVTVTNKSATATITLGTLDIPAGSGYAFGPSPGSGTLCASGLALSPSQSCVISVEFTPSALGSAYAVLTIQSTDNNGTQFDEGVNLSGTGVELDIAVFSTGEGGFPLSSVPVGSTSIATPFTLTNEGPSPMSVSLITITTNNQPASFSNQFFLSSASCLASSFPQGTPPIYSVSSFTIAPGDVCTFTLGFTPEVVGPVTGQITFAETAASSNICGTGSLASCTSLSNNLLEEVIPLSGAGTGTPGISVSPLSLNFPGQPLGTPVAAPPISLVNIGNVPLYFAAVGIAPASPNFADFTETTTCLTLSPLAPFPATGDSCTITVTFTPSTTTQQESASLFITDAAGNPTSIPLTGTGVATTVTDNETIGVTDSDTVDAFTLSPPITVAAPVADFSVGSPLGFGGQTGGQQTLAVSNIGQVSMALDSVATSIGSPFMTSAITCFNGATAATLPLGGFCSITITYTGSSPATDTGTLTFTDNAALSNLMTTASGSNFTQSITLNGSGTSTAPPPPPPATIDVPTSGPDNEAITVTDTDVVKTYYPSSVQLTTSANGSVVDGAPVTLTAQVASTLSGALAAPTGTVTFLNGLTILGGGTLSAQGVVTATTNALPPGVDPITAQYNGDANFAGSTSPVETVSVNAPDYKLSANPSTLTVAAGESGSTTITVTPADLFLGSVTFSCGTLPSYITCTFTPSNAITFPILSTSPQMLTLTVAVAKTVTAAQQTKPFILAMVAPLGLLGLALIAGGSCRRLRLCLGLAALALAVAGGIAGCSSGGQSNLPPTGTQNFTISAAGSGGITHQLQLSIDITN